MKISVRLGLRRREQGAMFSSELLNLFFTNNFVSCFTLTALRIKLKALYALTMLHTLTY